jgi:hypothetical protein
MNPSKYSYITAILRTAIHCIVKREVGAQAAEYFAGEKYWQRFLPSGVFIITIQAMPEEINREKRPAPQ